MGTGLGKSFRVMGLGKYNPVSIRVMCFLIF